MTTVATQLIYFVVLSWSVAKGTNRALGRFF